MALMQLSPFQGDFRLGILGGGQLGKMLIQKALQWNLQTIVMDPSGNAPCRRFASEFVQAKLTDFDEVLRFGRNVDLLTLEIEEVNADALARLEEEGKAVYPQAQVMKIIQDKGLQKQFYERHGIPTAPFRLVNNKKEVFQHQDFLPFAQKLRRSGYDGKGVRLFSHVSELENAFDAPSVLEKKVAIEKELAVIVARNVSGAMKTYEVVEMVFHQETHRLAYLLSPARVPESVAKEAKAIAQAVAEALEIAGLLAIEFFLDIEGRLLVNEAAPRPHNSGHHTIEACLTSQYEQHLRAILNLPLGSTEQPHKALMINLLGEPNHSGRVFYKGVEKALAMPGVYVHLYGKQYTYPYRKMGHITIIGDSFEVLEQKAQQLMQQVKVLSYG